MATEATTDPRDFTEKYNTPIPSGSAAAYSAWATKNGQDPVKGKYDYDLQGAFLSGDGKGDQGHFPDTFKKPNHPTFSDESQYNGRDGYVGGKWTDSGYQPSTTNLKFKSQPELQQYFDQAEPSAKLLPPAPIPSPTGAGGRYRISDFGNSGYGAKQSDAIPTPGNIKPMIKRLFYGEK